MGCPGRAPCIHDAPLSTSDPEQANQKSKLLKRRPIENLQWQIQDFLDGVGAEGFEIPF